MKPVIKLWCLAHDKTEEDYNLLHLMIVRAVVGAKIGVESQDDMVLLLPRDLMQKGLGEEIIIEVDFNDAAHLKAALAVRDEVKRIFPLAYVQTKVIYPDPNGQVWMRYV